MDRKWAAGCIEGGRNSIIAFSPLAKGLPLEGLSKTILQILF